MLTILPTPIGNLQDFSARSLETLKNTDLIACEDTRHTRKLLSYFNIKKPTISYHAGSKPEKIIKFLKEDKNITLVSDAGTPTISDPGSNLISLAIKNDIKIQPIPGPNAIITALSASGFPANHFEFLGYIPHKKGRQKLLKTIAEKKHTTIIYESTHRIIKFLQQSKEIFQPERQIMLAREMTKIYEEFLRGTPTEILEIIEQNPKKQKGEFTVVISGNSFVNVHTSIFQK